jgi:hypothetical protein
MMYLLGGMSCLQGHSRPCGVNSCSENKQELNCLIPARCCTPRLCGFMKQNLPGLE